MTPEELGFAKANPKKAKDLGFVSADKYKEAKTAAEQTGEIVAARGSSSMLFPTRSQMERGEIPKQEPRPSAYPKGPSGALETLADFFTGSARETGATRNLPEIGSEMGTRELLGEGTGALRGLTVEAILNQTFDPQEAVSIIEQNTSDPVSVQSDEAGNVILTVGDRKAVLNKPGVSGRDIMQLAGAASLFAMPAMRFIKPFAVGTGEAVIQAGVETAQSMAGGEFNPSEVVTAGLGGAAFQKLGLALADKAPGIFASDFKVDPKTRNLVREEMTRLGISAEDMDDASIDALVSRVRRNVTPQEGMAIQGEEEFGIPLTRAQRSRAEADLSFEDQARAGAYGNRAQDPFLQFERETQVPAINEAVERQRTALGGPGTSSRGEVGATLRESLQAAERQAEAAFQEAYESVGEASLDREGMNGLLNATRKAVIGAEFDRTLPETAKFLDVLKRTQKSINAKGAKAVPLKRIEMLRKRLGTAIDAADNNADRRQLTIMKRNLDDQLDRAVMNGLFKGDQESLNQLKQARGLFREYAQKFRSNTERAKSGKSLGTDQAGSFVEKVVEANPTDEEVVNMLFGVSNLNRPAGARLAQRVGDILGKDSEAYNALREEAFRRLVKTTNVNGQPVVSASKSISALQDAIEKNGTLIRELFTDDEIGTIRRLFAQIKRTQPDLVKSRQNPSGSGIVALQRMTQALSSMFDGGLTFAIASNGISMASTKAGKAKKAIRPFQNVSLPKPQTVGAAVGGLVASPASEVGTEAAASAVDAAGQLFDIEEEQKRR